MQNKDLAQAILDTVLDGVVTIDTCGIIRDINAAGCSIFGYEKSELIGKNVSILVPSPDRENHDDYIRRYLNTGEAKIIGYGREVEAVRKSGKTFPIELAISETEIKGERMFVGVTRDISEQKQLYEQLKRNEELLNTMGNTALIGGWEYDANSDTIRWTQQIYEIYGVPQDVIPTMDLYQSFFAPEARDLHNIVLKFTLETGKPFDLELPFITANGERRWARVQGFRPRGINHHIVQGSLQDITEAVLKREELLQAKNIAETANQSKTVFLSRISHDIRTPLNAIIGLSDLVKSNAKLNDENQAYMEEILKAGDHLLCLINELLDFSSMESGKISFNNETLLVCYVIDEALSLVQPIADKHGVRIYNKVHYEDSCTVVADKLRLKEILVNLLSNAIKYNAAEGSVIVKMKTIGPYIRIEIHDTGKGIPAHLHSRVFDPFERLDNNGQRIEGTGIGLSICKHLIEMMSGSIGMESTEGVGSMFWIELPIASMDNILQN